MWVFGPTQKPLQGRDHVNIFLTAGMRGGGA